MNHFVIHLKLIQHCKSSPITRGEGWYKCDFGEEGMCNQTCISVEYLLLVMRNKTL